ncbi:MAG: hypothetical protein IJW97_08715 [Clostridia bacterium]|nr:hypothetical protein [Clostridia bacterium]
MSRVFKTKTWEQYEAGRAFKRKLRLDETVWRNECFYRGEQWGEDAPPSLPRPVFNVVRRVTDYLISTVAGGNLSVTYTEDGAPAGVSPEALRQSVALLNRHVCYRWERCRMDRLVYRLLLDAALSGDGVLYCYWDPKARGSGPFAGDIRTVTWPNTQLFCADMNRADIQGQEYIILAGRESVGALRREGKAAGLSADACKKIRPDVYYGTADRTVATPELEGESEAKATVLTKFWKQDGVVWFERSTAEVVLRRVRTAQRLYPVAYFNWMPRRSCFHGTAPVTAMIPNQKYINRAYAMVMKHMTDTAFSKVIYDKSRIPEWSGEVGQAVAAVGGNLSDAVQVVGTGQLQDGYMALIENAMAVTKEMMGATDTALGSAQAHNTSAILALQEASRTAVQQVSAAYLQCIEDVVSIWADMMCACYNDRRPLTIAAGAGKQAGFADFSLLRRAALCAKVEVGNISRYSASGTQSTLDRLLDGGHITLRQYLECLPAGILPMRAKLLEDICASERGGQEHDGGDDGAGPRDGADGGGELAARGASA